MSDQAPHSPELYARRAARAFAAMEARFRKRSGLYRRDGRLHLPWTAAHLWPFARAIVATLDLAGVDRELVEGVDVEQAIARSLGALERYWDPSGELPAYSSDVRGTRIGGDRYHDDNAWVGLALIQHERLRPGSGSLARARELFRFSAGGWDRCDVAYPGGVYWVEQGRGVGRRNHDRNTVSNAPNAELGLHLTELLGVPVATETPTPRDMYEWVLGALDAGADSGTPGTGLFWDKVRGDGTIDTALWTYNQGSMVGANVLLSRRGGRDRYLARAEEIARKALRNYAAGELERQPPAFNAIFFRNLLLLHAATDDEALRTEIAGSMRGYAEFAWSERRDRRDRFDFPGHGGVTLLNQSAIVQVLALLAWDPVAYGALA